MKAGLFAGSVTTFRNLSATAGSGIDPGRWKPHPHQLRLDGKQRTTFPSFAGDARAIEAAAAIKNVQAAAERKSGKKLLALRTDRGGEFAAGDFTSYCAQLGVRRETTAPYSPQQNGVVERRNAI